jgi:hypothetical protein
MGKAKGAVLSAFKGMLRVMGKAKGAALGTIKAWLILLCTFAKAEATVSFFGDLKCRQFFSPKGCNSFSGTGGEERL